MQSHHLILEERESLSISGVTEVDSFDDRAIIIYTTQGELTIQGKNLKIHTVSTETSSLTVSGEIWVLRYGDKDRKGTRSFLQKLFQ
jgi:sporulation protein YabP